VRRRATRWAGVSDGLGVEDVVEEAEDGGGVGGDGAGREACGAVGVKRVKVSDGLRDMVRRVWRTGIWREIVLKEDLSLAVVQMERH
jgi:hypothetical protein